MQRTYEIRDEAPAGSNYPSIIRIRGMGWDIRHPIASARQRRPLSLASCFALAFIFYLIPSAFGHPSGPPSIPTSRRSIDERSNGRRASCLRNRGCDKQTLYPRARAALLLNYKIPAPHWRRADDAGFIPGDDDELSLTREI
jgi:hypothetical protein